MHIYEGHEVQNSSVVLLGDYRALEKENVQLKAELDKFYTNRYEADKLYILAGRLKKH